MDLPLTAARSGLAALLRDMIVAEGPITVERYMALCLGHPTLGYYMTRDPFGATGDFTTAPEISQMFGELLGLWVASVWQAMRSPARLHLVELGPGRGTLMADALRAARALPAFRAAVEVHLVETSPVLRQMQERTLEAAGAVATWHGSVDTLPRGPTLVLANEFFDALPIRQYMRSDGDWRERLVGLDRDDGLVFGLAADPETALTVMAPPGAMFELAPAGLAIMTALAGRVVQDGGAILAVDYGHDRTGFADTLQAIRAHGFVDPLAAPGASDLTAHVDFAALGRAATRAGASVHGPVPQGAFLHALGLASRADTLRGRPGGGDAIDVAVDRLAGRSPGMGDLFKVVAVTHPDMPVPPGFEPQVFTK